MTLKYAEISEAEVLKYKKEGLLKFLQVLGHLPMNAFQKELIVISIKSSFYIYINISVKSFL